jgi:hypothetical protein
MEVKRVERWAEDVDKECGWRLGPPGHVHR